MTGFYAGLDVSDATTAICVIDRDGETVFEASSDTKPLSIARALKPYSRVLVSVGQEAGSKSPWLQRELAKRHLPIVCLDPRLAHSALGAQRNKTDQNDARAIARLLRSGWYTKAYVKSEDALRLRMKLLHRRAIKRRAIQLENSLRMSVKVFGARMEKKKGRAAIVRDNGKPDLSLSRIVQPIIRSHAALVKEVDALDIEFRTLAKTDKVCRRLMTVPGIGPITSLMFKASVDDPHRFSSSRDVAAYFGLTPRRFQSGQMDVLGHISRMGDNTMRSALYEAAIALLCNSKSKCALRMWGVKLRERKGLKIAAIACARKLAVVMHRMWITGRDFDKTPVT